LKHPEPAPADAVDSGYADRRKPAVLWTLAAITVANALWMLASPTSWFDTIPGVAHTGPFNVHLVRDVGCAYLTMGLLLALAARWRRGGFALLIAVAIFMVLHALLHVWDVLAGRLPMSHTLTDLPLVFLPGVLTVGLAFWFKDD
jgi:hypothetical protein